MTLTVRGIGCCILQKRNPVTPRDGGTEEESNIEENSEEVCVEAEVHIEVFTEHTLHVAKIERDYKHIDVIRNKWSILSYLVHNCAKTKHVIGESPSV